MPSFSIYIKRTKDFIGKRSIRKGPRDNGHHCRDSNAIILLGSLLIVKDVHFWLLFMGANGLSIVNVTLVKVVQDHLNTHNDNPGARIPGRNSEQQVCNDLGSL